MKSQRAELAEKSGQKDEGLNSAERFPLPFSCPNVSASNPLLNRRRFLSDAGIGLGAIALTSLLGRQGLLAANLAGKETIRPVIQPGSPYAPRQPHFTPKAKNVLVIFSSGGCSHLDTFDYKPARTSSRLYSDAELVSLAEKPSRVACECPRHLAEIVTLLVGFELYSADCASRSETDAALHQHLHEVTSVARTMFEQALARVVIDQGLVV